MKAFVEKMKPHAALAARSIVIGIENHINNLIDTPNSLLWLADFTRDMPGIGIALAPYHLPQDAKSGSPTSSSTATKSSPSSMPGSTGWVA